MLALSGNTTISRPDKLLNIANELQKRLGTQNPESIINEEGKVYCWDSKQGVAWRYTSGGGQFEISEVGMRNEFLSRRNFNGFVKGGFERKYNTYYISFEGDFTFGFQEGAGEERPKWTCRFEWNPDAYGLVSNEFITIKSGELWVHEQNLTGLIYGQPVQSFITFVVNEIESAIKLFWRIEQSSSSLWYASVIRTLPDELYPIGMESELIASKWKSYEGHYKADFLRDANDPSQKFLSLPSPTRRVRAMLEGRKLRGEVLIITLYLQNPNELSILREANTYFSFSEKTSK